MPDPTQTTAQPQPQGIPLIDDQGNPGLVAPDKVDAALATGKYQRAYQMMDQKGNVGYVAESKVAAARQANYAVTPDNPGVQRMATPQGQLTYALPNEVDQFKASGHVPIDDSGNFRVDPLPGEDNTDTMARAAAIAKNLPPDVMQKALEAEKKTLTAKRVATTLVAAPVIGAAGAAALAAPGEITEGVKTAASAINASPAAVAAGAKLGGAAGTAVRLATSPVGKFLLKRAIETAGLGLGYKLVDLWMKK